MCWKICRSLILCVGLLANGSLFLMGCVKKEIANDWGREKTKSETISKSNKSALVNIELGLGYLEMEQISRAKVKLTHALQLAPKLPEAHTSYAYFLEKVGDLKEAEQEHKEAIQLATTNLGAVYNNYGTYLCRQGQFVAADAAFQNALTDKKYARTAEVYENAGLCALKGAQYQKAEHYLKTAIQRDPNRLQAKNALQEMGYIGSTL